MASSLSHCCSRISSTFAAVRVLFVLEMLFDLSVTAMDVKDAFLLVDQKEEMYVLIPTWIREIAQDGATHWLLKKCLPGQRNAALRWYEHFSSLCIDAGMEPYLGCPTIMKLSNQVRKVFLSVHVDDILFIGKPEDVSWFSNTAGSSLTMKVDGPHEQGSGKMLHYLDKNYSTSGRCFDSAQQHLHPEVDFFAENLWSKRQRSSISLYVGSLQCRVGE